MASLNSSDLILQKLPLANSTSVDIAPFAFETDKTGLAPAEITRGGKRRKTVRKRTRKSRKAIKRRSICRNCGRRKI
jgi:hypothetical protein